MKTYIVYIAGEEVGYIKARSQASARRKAALKYQVAMGNVICVYTEI